MKTRVLLTTLSLSVVLAASGCSAVIDATKKEPIHETPTSRTTGSLIDDELIEVKALVNIGKASEALRNSHVSVTSYNGVVLLTGQVPDENSRSLAESVVREIRKVRIIHNELAISGPTSHIVRTNDTWITAKIKVHMLGDTRIKANSVKVVTENGVVYLMGLVKRADADTAVEVVKEAHGVQKIVKMFEYID